MNIVVSEWIKVRSVRSTWVMAVSCVVVTVLVSLVGVTGLVGEGAAVPDAFDPTAAGFKGILVGQLLIAALGSQAITAEYASGQIISTLTLVPRRRTLLLAKLAVVSMVAVPTAFVTVVAAFGASQATLAAAGWPIATLGDPDVVRALACAVVYLVLASVLGLAFGTITRSSSGALSIIVTVALLIPALTPGLPGVVGEALGTYWPTTAGQASYTVVPLGGISPVVGLVVLAISTIWTAAAASLVFLRRDA